jgi:ATP-dependent Clp protease ATP-binding subunit ClpC
MSKHIIISEEVQEILKRCKERTEKNHYKWIIPETFVHIAINKYLGEGGDCPAVGRFLHKIENKVYSLLEYLEKREKTVSEVIPKEIQDKTEDDTIPCSILLDGVISEAMDFVKGLENREEIVELDTIFYAIFKHDELVSEMFAPLGITPQDFFTAFEESNGNKKKQEKKYDKGIKNFSDLMNILKDVAKNITESEDKAEFVDADKEDSDDDPDDFERYGDNRPIMENMMDKDSTTPYLDQFAQNMNKEAAEGKYDPVIGRDGYVQSIIEILSKRKKANVALVGAAGTGKSSIVELLTQQIVKGNVPERLKNKKIYSLNLNNLVAGTKYRGEYEERLQRIIEEVIKNKDIIIYIDELHNLVGNGGSSGNGDGANILKPYLSRGEFQCIGATTNDEYRKFIEKDAALNRRFTQVDVTTPTAEETIRILKGIQSQYESFHRVKVSKEVIEACVRWSDRYITDKNFPDKAVDVLDLSLAIVSLRRVELVSEKKDELEKKLQELVKEKIKAVQEDRDFDKGTELKDQCAEIEDLIEAEEKSLNKQRNQKKTWPEVTIPDVALAVSCISRVPVDSINQTDREKIAHMKAELEKRVIGQQEAIDTITQALQLNFLGLRNEKKPLCSILAVGPSGVGKTLISQEVAKIFFGSLDNLVKIDGGEFKEEHSLSKLIGSPAGYVGYGEDCIFEKVRRKKHSVILIDEVDKIHPSLYDIWLGILETSRCKLANGEEVDFSNCVIIFTGNTGTKELKNNKNIGFGAPNREDKLLKNKAVIMKAVEKQFRPEFLNRLDKIVVFNELSTQDLIKIYNIEMLDIKKKLSKFKIYIKVNNALRDYTISKCNPLYGARDLSRNIEKYIISPISEVMLKHPGVTKFSATLEGETTKVTPIEKVELVEE